MLAPSNAPAAGLAVNNTALPPRRICGQRWVASPPCKSVTGVGGPPAEGIRDKPPVVPSDAMMVPSSPQLPPLPLALHKVIAESPSTEIFFRLDPVKKATHCPSGAKKGANAP